MTVEDLAAERPAAFEMAARDASGALIWLGWDVRFLGAEGGGEFQAVARDATAARRLRAERDKAQEEARAAAVGAERLRIAHDLHDTLVRSIVMLIAEARLVARTTTDEAAKSALDDLEAEARAGLREAREAITRMREARREDDDLGTIVETFARRSHGGGRVDIRAELSPGVGDLPRETEELMARVLREALRNIELHAGARRVEVELSRQGETVRLGIRDDGVGFDPLAPTPGHYGVAGMRERARLAGATLDIASAPGEGTQVTLMAPIKDTKSG
jgi:signal transduction histidine kinase